MHVVSRVRSCIFRHALRRSGRNADTCSTHKYGCQGIRKLLLVFHIPAFEPDCAFGGVSSTDPDITPLYPSTLDGSTRAYTTCPLTSFDDCTPFTTAVCQFYSGGAARRHCRCVTQ